MSKDKARGQESWDILMLAGAGWRYQRGKNGEESFYIGSGCTVRGPQALLDILQDQVEVSLRTGLDELIVRSLKVWLTVKKRSSRRLWYVHKRLWMITEGKNFAFLRSTSDDMTFQQLLKGAEVTWKKKRVKREMYSDTSPLSVLKSK